jgi:murein DD-endopeptidase MepM/ murein hydrolase activator NlpD
MVDELGIGQSEFDFSGTPGMGGSDAQISDDSLSYHALLNELVIHRKIEGKTVPSGRPGKSGWWSSTYGWRIDPFSGKRRFHSGVDFAGQRGTRGHGRCFRCGRSGVPEWWIRKHGYH